MVITYLLVVDYNKFVNVTYGGTLESNSLTDMSSLEDVILIVNSLQDLQQLRSPYSSFETIHNSSIYKKTCFVVELKLAS